MTTESNTPTTASPDNNQGSTISSMSVYLILISSMCFILDVMLFNKFTITFMMLIIICTNILTCILSIEYEINQTITVIIIIIITIIIFSPLIFIEKISQKLESISYFQEIYQNTMKEIIMNNQSSATEDSINKFKLENPLILLIQSIFELNELILLTLAIISILMNIDIITKIIFIILFILIIIYFNHHNRNNSISI
jgi:hypothetical protein